MAALRAVWGRPGLPALRRGLAGPLRWLRETPWGERLRRRRLRGNHDRFTFLRDTHGPDVAAAAFALSSGGGVRFDGGGPWLRPGSPLRPESLGSASVVALDLRGCPVTYDTLDHLVELNHLEELDLSECPLLDDWTLARFHAFAPTLRRLSLARCPRVTERGLATLHHLRELRVLDVTGLRVPSPELVRILLEESLPRCRVLGVALPGDESPP